MEQEEIGYIIPERLIGNAPSEHTFLQQVLEPYVPELQLAWWSVWTITLVLVLLKYLVGFDVFVALKQFFYRRQ